MKLPGSKGVKANFSGNKEKIRQIWWKYSHWAAAEINFQGHFPKVSIYSKSSSGFRGGNSDLLGEKKRLLCKLWFFLN